MELTSLQRSRCILQPHLTGQWAILNKSWKQHPTIQQLYSHWPPIFKTIQIKLTRYAWHCWRNKDRLMSDNFQWITSYEWTSVGWHARTYSQQVFTYTGCSQEDLPGLIDDRVNWRVRVREIRAKVQYDDNDDDDYITNSWREYKCSYLSPGY